MQRSRGGNGDFDSLGVRENWDEQKGRDESGAEVSQAGLSFAVISVSLAGLAVQAIASRSHSRWSWVKINWS